MPLADMIGDEAIPADMIGQRTIGQGSSFPTSWHVNGMFLRTDQNIVYRNTGTQSVPVWSKVIETANVGFALVF